MQFQPKTKKEISEGNLWKEGVYNFKIFEAKDAVSKAGKEMIVLKLNVFNDEGQSKVVYDYLLEATASKLRNSAEACGIMEQYEQGHLSYIDFVDKTGELKLIIQKDKTGNYPDKNSVADYIVIKNDKPTGNDKPAGDVELDDEIPF